MTGRRAARPRRGFGLALTVLALVILAMIAGSLLRRVSGARRVLRTDERITQADWLAESGLERAALRLADDPGYSGETWTIPADALDGHDAARVRISVEPVAGRPEARRVVARAEFPIDAPRRARRTRTAIMALKPGPSEGPEEEP